MADISKENSYSVLIVEGKSKFCCKVCNEMLSTKQRVFTHLINKHDRSPLKRVYRQYADDPSIPVPERRRRRLQMHNTLHLNESHTEENSSFYLEHAEVSSQACSSEHQLSDASDVSCPKELNNNLNSCISDNSSASAEDSSCSEFDSSFSDLDSDPDNCSNSDLTSPSDINSDSSMNESDYHDSNQHSYDNGTSQQYSSTELQCICVMSYVLRHNASGVATKHLIELINALCPHISKKDTLSYDKVMSLAGNTKCKVLHYCSLCDNVFPDDPNKVVCSNTCAGFRYKGLVFSTFKGS